MHRETRDNLLAVVAAGAVGLLAVSPAVAQTGTGSSTGKSGTTSRSGTQMEKSSTGSGSRINSGTSGPDATTSGSPTGTTGGSASGGSLRGGSNSGGMGPQTGQSGTSDSSTRNLKKRAKLSTTNAPPRIGVFRSCCTATQVSSAPVIPASRRR